MFPYERFLAVLKAYVRNRAHPESCIMEGYTTEEVVECCADYVKVKLDYSAKLQIPVFKCQWVKHLNCVSVENYGPTLVDLNNVGHKDDPWVITDCVA
jgi:hypothetical protein